MHHVIRDSHSECNPFSKCGAVPRRKQKAYLIGKSDTSDAKRGTGDTGYLHGYAWITP